PNQTGLKIILRGSQQLDSFPQAKQAFIKAAATWEGLILTPITVIIDVDFGMNRFGNPFPLNVLGSTLNQFKLTESAEYQSVPQIDINSASNPTEANLYNSLPITGFQPDIGTTDQVIPPTPVFRALNLRPAVPDPAGEMQELGPPPQIA